MRENSANISPRKTSVKPETVEVVSTDEPILVTTTDQIVDDKISIPNMINDLGEKLGYENPKKQELQDVIQSAELDNINVVEQDKDILDSDIIISGGKNTKEEVIEPEELIEPGEIEETVEESKDEQKIDVNKVDQVDDDKESVVIETTDDDIRTRRGW